MSLQKMGGWAAIAWLMLGVMGIGVTSLRQTAGVSNPVDGSQMIRYILDNALMYKLSPLLGAAAGCLLVVVVLGVQERLEAGLSSWVRLSVAFGVLAGGMFLLSGMIGAAGGDMLAQAYVQNARAAEGAYLPMLVVADAAGIAGLVAMGVWLSVVFGVGLRSLRLPKFLCYAGLVNGLMLVGVMVNLMFGIIGSVLALVVMPWLGVIMVRR